MIGLLNVGSLVLGLVAWILPIINLIKIKNSNNNYWALMSIMSLGACATSLLFQINYNKHLVVIEDWSALMDTINAVVYVSTFLLLTTILLNGIVFVIYNRKG